MLKKQPYKQLAIFGVTVILIIVGYNYAIKWFLTMMFGGGCIETPLYNAVSPDGSHVAIEFSRNCGPTTRILVHINIRERSAPFSSEEGGAITEGLVLSRYASDKFKVKWLDAKTLSIKGPSDKIMEKHNQYKGIKIEFNQK